MSKVTICDKCGKAIESTEVTYSFNVTRIMRDFVISNRDEFDLCADCHASIASFVGEPND